MKVGDGEKCGGPRDGLEVGYVVFCHLETEGDSESHLINGTAAGLGSRSSDSILSCATPQAVQRASLRL